MVQGVLGTTYVRHVGYGLEVGCSVCTAGGVGHIARPRTQLVTTIFPHGPGLAGTRMSPFWILLELRMMEVASGDNSL